MRYNYTVFYKCKLYLTTEALKTDQEEEPPLEEAKPEADTETEAEKTDVEKKEDKEGHMIMSHDIALVYVACFRDV